MNLTAIKNLISHLSLLGILTVVVYFFICPVLHIQFYSDTEDLSQIFFFKNNQFSEHESITQQVNIGENNHAYTLERLNPPLRWDPLTKAGRINVHEIYLTILGIRIPSPKIQLIPIQQIDFISPHKTTAEEQIIIQTAPDADDPILHFQNINFSLIKKIKLITSTLIALFFTLIIFKKKK